MRRTFALLALLWAGAGSTVSAQTGTRVEIRVDSAAREPVVRIRNLLQDPRWSDALTDALPITMQYRVELMRSRTLVPARERVVEWKVVVRQEQLLGHYVWTLQRPNRPDNIYRFDNRDAFILWLEKELPLLGVGPRREATYYYNVQLTISTLEDDELAQAEQSAGREGGFLNTIAQGLLRMFGLPTVELNASTPSFRIP